MRRALGARGALGERLALLDAEAVLLVHHDEAEPREPDALREEGLGAHDDGRGPGAHRHAPPVGLGLRDAPREEHRREAGRREQRVEGAQVLLGERLGGDEHGGLGAGLDRLADRQDGDQRLARADLALQEAPHRARRGEVAADLPDGVPLGGGEREGQRRQQRGGVLAGGHERRRGTLGRLRAAHRLQAELQHEQLLDHHPPPAEAGLPARAREVDRHEGVGGAGQLQARAHPGRQALRHGARQRPGQVHELADAARGHLLGGAVDGDQAAGVEPLRARAAEDLVAADGDLPPPLRRPPCRAAAARSRGRASGPGAPG